MRKQFKKIIATVLTATMMMSVTIPAFANTDIPFDLQEEEMYTYQLDEDTILIITSENETYQQSNEVVPYLNVYDGQTTKRINVCQQGKVVAIAKLEIDYQYGARKLWVNAARASLEVTSTGSGENTITVYADDSPTITKISDNEYEVVANYKLTRSYPNGEYVVSSPTISVNLFSNSDKVDITLDVSGLE